jgi:GNAT superfamily N-acetyltransferase
MATPDLKTGPEPTMDLEMKRLLRIEEDLFVKAYTLLQNAFIPDELRDFTPEVFHHPAFFIYAALQKGHFVGTTVFWELDEAILLEYLVTDPLLRGQRLGSQVLQWLLAWKPEKMHVGEIDPPHSEIARRRTAFFQRHGFMINEFDYLQPAYGPDKSPVPMVMISYPQVLGRRLFERIKQQIYQTVYPCASKTEPIDRG